MIGQPDGHLLWWIGGGVVPNMAQPAKKRPFVPSELDRRRAQAFVRKAEEIRQGPLAKILGISVRTLQRYMDTGPEGRAMPAHIVDRFEAQFGPIGGDSHSVRTPSQPQNGIVLPADDLALERALARHETELSYAQVKHARRLRTLGVGPLSEEQWEQLVLAILSGRQPSP